MDFPADIAHFKEMMSFIRSHLEKRNTKLQSIYRVELASEEVLANIISYGSLKPGSQISIICIDREGGELELTFSDEGVAFNPLEVDIQPKVDRPLDEREIGGLGIFLIRRLTDSASYQRIGTKNVLSLVFRL